jgi:trimethylamine--corrinoid protein Co-methyltransferase
MMGALEEYAAAGQACIISPFIVGGAMAPVSVMPGTLTQVLAEVLAGVAYSQLIRPGAPVIFGAFVTSIDMNSGAPTFGTPEARRSPTARASWRGGWGCPTGPAGRSTARNCRMRRPPTKAANSLNMALCRA